MPSEDPGQAAGLEDTLSVAADSRPRESDAGTERRIGPYRLLQLIGEGGMGEVWVAEQLEPVRRRVAVKVIKAGMDTKQVVARFEAERQALALMDHRAIAKVLDGGATPEGRPYFVMDYVAGVPITEHCDSHKLPTEERLRLLMEVCEGVQHAHHKAIIHRDLKPSNILVSLGDGHAQPKIIDFGIAKATGYRLTDKTLFTELGALIGTPEYMSPEQADLTSQDIDTRTDVYSLGVILYQLLTGELPFDSQELRSFSYEELRRKLRDVEPLRPSKKLSALQDRGAAAARNRSTESNALHRQLEGDLDAISIKAMEKDRARRYGTPSELASDLLRYLSHQTVAARPPSLAYRIQKYTKRHSLGVAFAAGLATLLVAFAATMGVQARRTAVERDRANAERDRASRERDASEKISAFLANMLSTLKPEELGNALSKDLHRQVETAHRRKGASEKNIAEALAALDRALVGVNPTETALHLLDEQILDRAGRTIEEDMRSDPRTAGTLEYTLAGAYGKFALFPQGEKHARRAVDIRRAAFGSEYPDTLKASHRLANLYWLQGRLDDAEALQLDTVNGMQRILGPDHPDTLKAMGTLVNIYMDTERYGEAEKLQLAALETNRRVLGPNDPETLSALGALGDIAAAQGRNDEAEKLLRESLGRRIEVHGMRHPSTLLGMNNLADLLRNEGRYPEAEELFREALTISQQLLGPQHDNTLILMSNLGGVYADLGRLDEAERLEREALELTRGTLGSNHWQTLYAASLLAAVYNGQGRYAEAQTLALEAVKGFTRLKIKDREDAGAARFALGRSMLGLRQYQNAERELLEAERVFSKLKNVAHKNCLEALIVLYAEWDGSTRSQSHAAQRERWKRQLGESDAK